MKIYTLEDHILLPISKTQAWDFFSNPNNLSRITPPELSLRIKGAHGELIHSGDIIEYTVCPLFGIPLSWLTEITHLQSGDFFIDEQRFGPYRFWQHRHSFLEQDGGTLVSDRVTYALPFPPFGDAFHGLLVRPQLEKIFSYRKKVLHEMFVQ